MAIKEYQDNSVEILLVEDNPGDMRLIIEAFKDAMTLNYNISVAKDGEEAMQILYREGEFGDASRPDLLVLDIYLPKKNGREVLSEIRQNPDLRCIPTVILTGSNHEVDIINIYEDCPIIYLIKPSAMDSYTNVVKSIEEFWLTIPK